MQFHTEFIFFICRFGLASCIIYAAFAFGFKTLADAVIFVKYAIVKEVYVMTIIDGGLKIAKDYQVVSYDADRQQNIKLSSLQRWFQDAADAQCTHFGCDYITMREKMNMVFLLVKSSINIYSPLKLEGNYTVTTWNKGAKGIQFFRDFSVTDKDGKVYAEGGTSWVLVDPNTHRMKKPAEVTFPVPECRDDVQGTRLGKMQMPELQYASDKLVYYTEIDSNEHLTNWVYADIVTNALPDLKGKYIAEMDISYAAEAFEGEVIKLYRANVDGVWYIRGEHPRGKCFEARCKLADISPDETK